MGCQIVDPSNWMCLISTTFDRLVVDFHLSRIDVRDRERYMMPLASLGKTLDIRLPYLPLPRWAEVGAPGATRSKKQQPHIGCSIGSGGEVCARADLG